MKKHLVIVATFIIMASTSIMGASAISIESQSRDVMVGEVDEISPNDETVAHTPDTGLFGFDADSAPIVMTTLLAAPTIIIFVYLFRFVHRRHTK